MSEEKKTDVEENVSETQNAEKSEVKVEADIPKPDPKWRIVNQIGRTIRPVSGPGKPERMRSEFERMRGIGMPGTIQLLNEKGGIEDQHASFTDDKPRRYRDEDGKPYEPTMVNMGREPVDLSKIADVIRSMPETDPDEDPPPKPERLNLRGHEQPKSEPNWRPVPGGKVDPELAAKLRDAAQKAKQGQVKSAPHGPAPRSERMKNAPCRSGLTGIISFFTVAGAKLDEMSHTEDRIRRRRRRFKLELLVRVLFGAPVCSNTAEAAYVDAVDATRV